MTCAPDRAIPPDCSPRIAWLHSRNGYTRPYLVERQGTIVADRDCGASCGARLPKRSPRQYAPPGSQPDPAGRPLCRSSRKRNRRSDGCAFTDVSRARAMLDLNRAPDDVDWGMVIGGEGERNRHSVANRRARNGLGLVPRRLPTLGEIWKQPISRAELDMRVAAIHRPYHRVLGQTLEKVRDRWGTALLIDLHSMPPLKVRHRGERAAQFVIGDRSGRPAMRRCQQALSAISRGTIDWRLITVPIRAATSSIAMRSLHGAFMPSNWKCAGASISTGIWSNLRQIFRPLLPC